jgi:hypothetical protein
MIENQQVDMCSYLEEWLGVLNERSASRASSGSARISSTRILNEALREHLFLARIINEASSARLD